MASCHPEDPVVARARELAIEAGNEWVLRYSFDEDEECERDEIFGEYMERARQEMEEERS